MLEATVKFNLGLHDFEKTSQHVDELDKAYHSLEGEIRSVKADL